jgi:aryl-alcohol dehydrogenase-like predicted oxidoreductase
MHYRRLGRTEMMVSEIGFGAFPIGGGMWGRVDDSESLAALQSAFDLGVNFFDTADVYGHGRSEELIGRVFGQAASKRANVIIATKVGFDFRAGEPARPNFDPAYIRLALEASLARLGTDYVDLYQLHNPPQKLAKDDAVWETLRDLKAEGKVRFYGVSARTANDAHAYLKAAMRTDGSPGQARHFGDTLQVAYNLVDQEAASKGIFVEAHRQDWGLISRVPLASGLLSGKYRSSHKFPPGDFRGDWSRERLLETVSRVEALRFLATPERSMAQAALTFALSQQPISTVIAGAKTREQVEANVAASELAPLSEEEVRQAEALYASNQAK